MHVTILNYHVHIPITSSIYGSCSYMKWRYGRVRHGTSAGKCCDIASGVLELLGLRALLLVLRDCSFYCTLSRTTRVDFAVQVVGT